MKTFTKILLGSFFLLFALWYFTNQSRISLKSKLDQELKVNNDLDSMVVALNSDVYELINAKVHTDTIKVVIAGEVKKVYDTIYLDKVQDIQIKKDSVFTDELKLNYVAEYVGKIYNITFDYEVSQKEIIKESIVYVPEPYPVEKEVPIITRNIYLGCQINSFGIPYASVLYSDKKNRAFTISYGIDKSLMIGAYYKIF